MNRIIKFRAWIKSKKYMRKVGEIYDPFFKKEDWGKDQVAASIYVYKDWKKPANCFSFSDIILMQYTWLKDKNWVEVYEGDIVRSEFDNENFEIQDIRCIWVENSSEYDATQYWEFKVIWNIYENPELLDNKWKWNNTI